jgi:antitoxin component YwqK of YwqJK toxin-antitoxin module
MKWRFLILLLITAPLLHAQQTIHYYDHQWKPIEAKYAAYYSIVDKDDSLWIRKDYFVSNHALQMQGHYTDTSCKVEEGVFYYFYSNGNLQRTGNYLHGKKNGIWVGYYENKMMSDSIYYVNGNETGTLISWYRDGTQQDSSTYINDSIKVTVSWFNNEAPTSAGRYLNQKKHGSWVYYNKKGVKTAWENYDRGILLSKIYYSETGEQIDTLKNTDKAAEFPGGDSKWSKYLYGKIYYPDNVQFVNTDKVVVVVSFEINEEGKLINESIITPFHDEYDNIVLKILRGSPNWKPRVDKNRNVATIYKQAVYFSEVQD